MFTRVIEVEYVIGVKYVQLNLTIILRRHNSVKLIIHSMTMLNNM